MQKRVNMQEKFLVKVLYFPWGKYKFELVTFAPPPPEMKNKLLIENLDFGFEVDISPPS